MNYVDIFPIVIGETILSDISDDQIEQYKIYMDGLEYEGNDGLYRGSLDQRVLDKPIFSQLKSLIIKNAKEYFDTHGLIYEDIEIVNSWATRTDIDEASTMHTHANSYLSGVYYLQESSNINFYNPTDNLWMFQLLKKYKKDQPYTYSFTYYPPVKNSLIFFPSFLAHKVEISKRDNRKSIAFNIIPRGKMGENTAYINL